MNTKHGLVMIFALLVFWIWQQWPDTKLKIVFCDVGQGDAALVILGSFQALVDTGAYEEKIMTCLGKNLPFWDREIEILFLSHADKDHSGQAEAVKRNYKVDRVVDKPHSGDLVRYGNLHFDILKGSEPVDEISESAKKESNETSVLMRMVYGKTSVLFTGDLPSDAELALIPKGVLMESNILKVGHHGSKYSSAKEFLEIVKPSLAVISVSAKNNYGHPASDTLLRLDTVGSKVLRTDKVGTITIRTDGENTEVFSEK